METILNLYKKYKEVVDYIFFGFLTTVFSLAFYLLFTRILGFTPAAANIAKWVSGVLFAFVVNKLFVFNSKSTELKTVFREFTTFVGGRVLSGVIDELIVIIGCNVLGINDLIVQLFDFVFVIVAN
ncbi:MAG: GtrA family protein, partial [Erysipelotrichaceae bacterium]|nr:GtrA family protein [Erysipelotrichaceae bacterium]